MIKVRLKENYEILVLMVFSLFSFLLKTVADASPLDHNDQLAACPRNTLWNIVFVYMEHKQKWLHSGSHTVVNDGAETNINCNRAPLRFGPLLINRLIILAHPNFVAKKHMSLVAYWQCKICTTLAKATLIAYNNFNTNVFKNRKLPTSKLSMVERHSSYVTCIC